MNPLATDVFFDVFKFCKEKGIECSWDFSKCDNKYWTEVFVDGDMVFQIDASATVQQFIELVEELQSDFKSECKDISGDDFRFVVDKDEKIFRKFVEKHNIQL